MGKNEIEGDGHNQPTSQTTTTPTTKAIKELLAPHFYSTVFPRVCSGILAGVMEYCRFFLFLFLFFGLHELKVKYLSLLFVGESVSSLDLTLKQL